MKRICNILIVICFLIALCGCDNPASISDVMFLNNYDSTVFNETTCSLSYPYEQFIDDKISESKSITIGKETYNLIYKDSTTQNGARTDAFTSVDGKITCQYDNRGKLFRLIVEDMDTLPTFASEAEYIDWCKKYMSILGFSIPEEYVYSCKTDISVKGDDCAYLDVNDSFVAPTENTVSYCFAFTRYEDSIPTTDKIEIYMDLFFNALTVRFDSGQFADGISMKINLSEINSSVNEFIKSSIRSDRSLKSCDIVNQRLTYIDNRLCVISTVKVVVSTGITELVNVVSYLA